MDEMSNLNEVGGVRELTDALRAIGREIPAPVSAQVEARLLAEFRSSRRERRPSRSAFGLGLAMAATLVGAIAVPVWSVMVRGRLPERPSAGAPAPTGQSAVATAFLPLMYSGVPAGDVQVIRLRVPRPALASFGLAPMEVRGGSDGSAGTVLADVLVGEDGLARAVRFVRASAGGTSPAANEGPGER
jgi:hypothetical protein